MKGLYLYWAGCALGTCTAYLVVGEYQMALFTGALWLGVFALIGLYQLGKYMGRKGA